MNEEEDQRRRQDGFDDENRNQTHGQIPLAFPPRVTRVERLEEDPEDSLRGAREHRDTPESESRKAPASAVWEKSIEPFENQSGPARADH
jgi:hypothetical protein